MEDRSSYGRRRALAAVVLAAALAVTAALLLGPCSSGDRRFAPAAGSGDGRYDPLAYRADRRAELERRAGAGLAHALYVKSPGGIVASARRTAHWRGAIDRAARSGGLDPDLLEAIVLLESAGRPEVIAGGDPQAAAGLTQIVGTTATQLLGMRVDLGRSRELTAGIATAEARGERRRAKRLRARRRRVDERFDPSRAIAATVRYLTLARRRFGREDLALASYHMGIGNLETTLRAYAGAGPDQPVAGLVADRDLSYARLYFDSTPLLHRRAYAKLAAFGDDSASYLWRLLAARRIMSLYRERPGELKRLAALHAASASAEQVLHPPGSTPTFSSSSLERGVRDGDLVEPPHSLGSFGLVFDRLAKPRRALRPEALSVALYIGAGSKDISGQRPLAVTAAARPAAAASGDDLHATGYAFDIARRYRSTRQAAAFQFLLDRLQAVDLIAWRRSGTRIHLVAAKDANELLPRPAKLLSR